MNDPWPHTDSVLAHFLEAVDAGDDDRIERILAKTQRAPEPVIAEIGALFRSPVPPAVSGSRTRGAIDAAYELLADIDTEAAVDATLLALSRMPGDLTRDERLEFGGMVEEIARRAGTTARQTALRTHTDATADGNAALARTCLDVIARLDKLDEDSLARLSAACESDPVHALECLAHANDPVVADLVAGTARGLGDVNTLDIDRCGAAFFAMRRLTEMGWERSFEDISFTATVGQRLLKLKGRKLERMEAQLDASVREMTRSHEGPNAPCPCGSGRKSKRCCG